MNIKQLIIIQKNFLHELQDAYAGKKTSLPFIIHELSPNPIVRNGEVFQVFVIGGSVVKTVKLRKNGNDIKILKTKQDQVNFKTEEDLLSFVEDKTEKDISVIALNFAYPIKPIFEKGRLDGTLLKVTKEGSFHGLIGKKIGKEIEEFILKKRNKKITVSIANDTVCLLLSGLTKYKWHELAGGVDGTGVNFAFFLNENSLVNLESANFDKFIKSKEAKIIDKESNIPGAWLFEKETAGAYLYKHFNIIMKDRKINYSPINSTEELNRISLNRGYSSSEVPTSRDESRSSNDDSSLRQLTDRTITKDVNHKTSEIAKHLLTKSAQLVACQIAGITEFKKQPSPLPSPSKGEDEGEGEGEGASMVFNMEGSLFWKANGYKETVEQTVKQLVPKHNVKFVEIKDSGILGAAKLVS